MKISIAMATYNGARYLQEQLDSFLLQTVLPKELVVCDDGSTDSTLDILKTFRKKAPFDVYICRNKTNLGFTKNFEKSALKCSGDLIFFSDQDDVWFPEKVEIIEKAVNSNPDKLLIIHDGKLVDDKLTWYGATKLGQVVSGFGSVDFLAMGGLTAIRKEFIPLALPIPAGVIGHDLWLHNVSRLLDARLVINQSLQLIRRHSSNTSDWIASSVTKIGKSDVFFSQLKTPIAKNYDDRLIINEASRYLLEKLLYQDNIFFRDAIKKNLIYLASEYEALNRRNTVSSAGAVRRKILSLELLIRGEYRYFNGLKSFFRDIFR